jgi:hypothetical protein
MLLISVLEYSFANLMAALAILDSRIEKMAPGLQTLQ